MSEKELGRMKLGEMLLESSLLSEDQLTMAMEFQKSVGGKLGEIIVKLGFIEDDTLIQFIARQQKLPVANISELVLPENLIKRLPRNLIEKHHVIPIHFTNGVLTIATSDPFDFEAMEEIQLAVDFKVDLNLAPRAAVLKAIAEIFVDDDKAEEKKKSMEDLMADLDTPGKLEQAKGSEIPGPVMKRALIALLIEKGIITEEELNRKARSLES